LWVKHALLPHQPWLYLPSGKQMRPAVTDPVRGMAGPRGFHDGWLTLENEQRQLLQIGFTDLEIRRLLGQLRAAGMLDQTLLVVTADHGYAWEVGVNDRRRVTERNVDEIAPVPLFIKAPGQRRGRIDRSYARTIDIVPTMADILGLRLPWRANGRSVFSRTVRRRRLVRLPTRSFDRIIKISARSLERRRRAIVRRRLRRFGFGLGSEIAGGSPVAELYWIGPRPGLIGRSLEQLRPGGPGRVRAYLANAGLTRAVALSSRLLPIQIGGHIAGGGRGRQRDIAVAVNGRIEAAGRSFHLRGRPGEGFSVLVPESSLREGSNDVRVFEVSGRGPPRLTLLGHN
jgi:Sulfatase